MILRISSYMVGNIDSINATHLCFYNKYEVAGFSINFLNNIINTINAQLSYIRCVSIYLHCI